MHTHSHKDKLKIQRSVLFASFRLGCWLDCTLMSLTIF